MSFVSVQGRHYDMWGGTFCLPLRGLESLRAKEGHYIKCGIETEY